MNTPNPLSDRAPALTLALPQLAPDPPGAAARRRPRSPEATLPRTPSRPDPAAGRAHEQREQRDLAEPDRDPTPGAPGGPADAGRGTWRAVYTIVERGAGRRLWLRIGTAFINRDLSLTVRLDAMPLNGQLHIREAPPPSPREPRLEPAAPSGV